MSGRRSGSLPYSVTESKAVRQPLGRHALAQQLEAPVGAEGIALAGEHARRVLVLALEGEGAGGVGEAARHVVQQQPLQQLAVVLVAPAAPPCGSCCPTAWCASARCGFPCRGSSPRTRRRRRPCCMSGHIASSLRAVGVELGLARFGQVEHRLDRAMALGLVGLQHGRAGRAAAAPRAPGGPARARGACSRARCRRCRPGSAPARRARSAPGACCGAWAPAAGGLRPSFRPSVGQPRLQRLVQRGHAVVVEAAGHGAEHRHLPRAAA